jgi:hypothetical protein
MFLFPLLKTISGLICSCLSLFHRLKKKNPRINPRPLITRPVPVPVVMPYRGCYHRVRGRREKKGERREERNEEGREGGKEERRGTRGKRREGDIR